MTDGVCVGGVGVVEMERRRKISDARKGKPTWNKGKTKETCEALMRISIATARIKRGVRFTEGHRRKISDAHKKIINWNYKGGIEPENKRVRKSIEYKFWRDAVYRRDAYSCKKCKVVGGTLHPHHIFNFSTHVNLRFDVNNGITLCKIHHKEFHSLYGQTNNTQKQLEEYLNESI